MKSRVHLRNTALDTRREKGVHILRMQVFSHFFFLKTNREMNFIFQKKSGKCMNSGAILRGKHLKGLEGWRNGGKN